jgi:hypothetical protein
MAFHQKSNAAKASTGVQTSPTHLVHSGCRSNNRPPRHLDHTYATAQGSINSGIESTAAVAMTTAIT